MTRSRGGAALLALAAAALIAPASAAAAAPVDQQLQSPPAAAQPAAAQPQVVQPEATVPADPADSATPDEQRGQELPDARNRPERRHDTTPPASPTRPAAPQPAHPTATSATAVRHGLPRTGADLPLLLWCGGLALGAGLAMRVAVEP